MRISMIKTLCIFIACFLGAGIASARQPSVEEIDFHVRRLLDSLHDLGIDENTFVTFTYDNGPWLTRPELFSVAIDVHGR